MMLAKWLTNLGVFVLPDFLERELCARLCKELRDAPARPANVTYGLDYSGVDESFRRTRVARPSSATRALLTERLTAKLPALSAYFRRSLAINEGPACLRYAPGDFFQVHRDHPLNRPARPLTRLRRVSVVIFLNQGGVRTAEIEPGFQGGELVLYDLLRHPGCEEKGIPLPGTTGWLVAFRSALRHEVKPIEHGERYSVVSWLTDAANAVNRMPEGLVRPSKANR